MRKHIDVNGREELENIIKDGPKCDELGLDQTFESMKYLKEYGEWMTEKPYILSPNQRDAWKKLMQIKA